MAPEQTAGKEKPFVYTQGQAVLNRAFFPCFDTPAVKCRYSALVEVRGLKLSAPALGIENIISDLSDYLSAVKLLHPSSGTSAKFPQGQEYYLC